jgi:hypothetical protein
MDGTILVGLTGSVWSDFDTEPNYYFVQGGVPVKVDPDAEESDLPGPVTGIGYADQLAIDQAGGPGLWSHLKAAVP